MDKLKRFLKTDGKAVAVNLIGCAVAGMSFSFFTYPNSIVSGGLTVEDLLRMFKENVGKALDNDRMLLS